MSEQQTDNGAAPQQGHGCLKSFLYIGGTLIGFSVLAYLISLLF